MGQGAFVRIGDSRPGFTQSFTYDALHRLVAATGPYGSSGYAYDAHGNRRTGSGTTYVYDSATLRLTAQNGRSFAYDSNGNLISEPGRTYTYTPENWLATVNGTQAAYLYDADGWRASKRVEGEHHILSTWSRWSAKDWEPPWRHRQGATLRERGALHPSAPSTSRRPPRPVVVQPSLTDRRAQSTWSPGGTASLTHFKGARVGRSARPLPHRQSATVMSSTTSHESTTLTVAGARYLHWRVRWSHRESRIDDERHLYGVGVRAL